MQGDSFAECQGACGPGRAGGGAGGAAAGLDGASGGSGGSGGSSGSGRQGRRQGGDAPAPAPPNRGEAVAVCPSPGEPVIGRNPDPEGMTGLETYLWAGAQEPHTARGVVRGFPVACTVTPVRWTWETGDGASYTRDRPGGPHPDHAAEHVYETKGEYTLTLTVLWRADTAYGSDTLTRRSSVAYRVFEVRSVRTG